MKTISEAQPAGQYAKANHIPDTTYQGWKNYQTWNVALWINNDENLYESAVEYVKKCKRPSYMGFVKATYLDGSFTPDRIKFNGQKLDYKALNKMITTLLD